MQVVERALQQTHETRVRLQLDRQLEAINQELQRKVHELTTILSIGKAVTSTTDPRRLFKLIVEGAMQVAESETSWLMIRDENTRAFLLTAHRNLPESWAKKINQPLDDGISSLVAVSAETLSIHGGPLEKFKVASLGRSAAVVPIKVQSEVIGLLIVVRKADREIDKVAQSLLEAVADYASISLVNARLFRVVEQNAEAAKVNEKQRLTMLESLRSPSARKYRFPCIRWMRCSPASLARSPPNRNRRSKRFKVLSNGSRVPVKKRLCHAPPKKGMDDPA